MARIVTAAAMHSSISQRIYDCSCSVSRLSRLVAMARDVTLIIRAAIYLCRRLLSPASFHDSIGGSRVKQESRAVVRKPRDAAAVLFGLKFADNIH